MRHGTLRSASVPIRGFHTMVGGNRVTLLHEGAAYFAAMLEAIAEARREILVEMYWFASDGTGWRFADALRARAREGVDVRVMYDAVGSWETDEGLFEAMRADGCAVEDYNPIAPWRRRFNLGVVNNRDHRKMLVVDGRVGFTGGVNLGDEWAPESEGGHGWRDDVIRIEGPAVRAMRALFEHTWQSMRGRGALTAEVGPQPPFEGGTAVQVLADRRPGGSRAIRRAYLDRIRYARERIHITNSYFVPDRAVRRALADAASRGVDVRVLVQGESDLPAVYFAGRHAYDWLLRHGVRLYEWHGSILHAKSAVVDDRWVAVGTYNLDWRSWRFNLEIVVAVEDARVGRAMEERFRRDLAQSVEVELRNWRYRPLSDRALESFFHLFRKLL
ncbi:MAG: phospholipase D-like domain-containing protein [Myxococcota bacterium]